MAETEAEAVAEIARTAIRDRVGETAVDVISTVVLRSAGGGETFHAVPMERYGQAPWRPRGTVSVLDADGFVAAVTARLVGPTTVYADTEKGNLVAVLNDDTTDGPGWRDYRVELTMRRTTEWIHWKDNQGKRSQHAFAEAVEAGANEIIEPSAAEALEIAQYFQATIDGRVTSSRRLHDGSFEVGYVEDVKAKTGRDGLKTIPALFLLNVRPFYGSDKWNVEARLSHAVKDGALQIGYQLWRPEDIERLAFESFVAVVAERLTVTPINGRAPYPVDPMEATR